MLELLAAWLTFGVAQAGEPRPSDEQLLAAVVAEAPESRILSSTFAATPQGGGWKGCGLIEVNGVVEPFAVLTLWQPARPEQQVVSSIATRGPDGQMVTTAIPPTPARPAHWEIAVNVPTHSDRDGDGHDWSDRNRDVLDRRHALSWCPNLVAPEGTTWSVRPEPNPDRALGARNAATAQRVTDAIFGAE